MPLVAKRWVASGGDLNKGAAARVQPKLQMVEMEFGKEAVVRYWNI